MKPFVCQIVGYKNSGKTTLVCALVERLKAGGCRVAVIKHDAHDFEMDHPGTDTYRHRAAGASAIALVSARKTAVIREEETSLDELIEDFCDYDVVLVEGFKQEHYPKLVMVRRAEDQELVRSLDHVAGVVSWLPEKQVVSAGEARERMLLFGKDEHERIADWLRRQMTNPS
ncbi:molybdopterin-guanine dinucleotide biosynthesis protein B [Paenibacillus sp. VCA1]|uniref:molybdopterin-guanine dinucleotide biosynthesis protein B n=1 Tax=Paenibacillus sp. VCA1 TaxID=3039148 RepID=UPI002871A1B9|nr:molybdopterin-guanine dinucleotide biosynthesis protein B [Paenibacillus sp. VCA1]MDR9854146.1 molybdopterin-guanine dinucleotide biosynthesis protein B [Paenibacillus sp. VCA1]